MDEDDQEGTPVAGPSEKVRRGMKRYWAKNSLKLKTKNIRRVLLEQPASPPDAGAIPFMSVIEGGVINPNELFSLILDDELPKVERPIVGRMLAAWLADPASSNLHFRTLLSSVTSVAKGLQRDHRPSDFPTGHIDTMHARLVSYRGFFQGLHHLVEQAASERWPETSDQIAAETKKTSAWVLDALIMYTGLHHLMGQIGPANFSNILSANKARQVPSTIEWRSSIEGILTGGKQSFERPNKRRIGETRTIKNELDHKGAAPAVAYAAYNVSFGDGECLLHRIIVNPASLHSYPDHIRSCLGRARFVFDTLTPGMMKTNIEPPPGEAEAFDPKPFEENVRDNYNMTLQTLAYPKAGRQKPSKLEF
ncbi:hypothetical protein FJ936_06470 [Mesorhizobium sp. B2-4-13]|uniref:hypothetical protein n=1 Tax=Mesorhizobium sp. B2-4-13 TaxID=2589936 RepID=UPI0011513DC9|nr:hypothetical protein [Mesorhizobium sp. B2-4-13]TPK86989.1 hypothetical protein FJ936_06470 [Mesorhizobium sp. B2-4-13]